jgi:DNA-binding XRE family transcriptional regulator
MEKEEDIVALKFELDPDKKAHFEIRMVELMYFTKADFANSIQISPSYLSAIFNGKSAGYKTAYKIATGLKCKVEDLFTLQEQEKQPIVS